MTRHLRSGRKAASAAAVLPVLLSAPLLLVPGREAAAQATAANQGAYANRVNARFATVSSGPQSALIVDVDAPTGRALGSTPQEITRAAIQNLWSAQAPILKQQIAKYRAGGLLGKNSVVPVSTIVFERQNGQIVLPASSRAAGRALGNGTLTFQFSGFTSSDQAALQEWLNRILPAVTSVYGAPAQTATITIVNESNFSDVEAVALGAYDVSSNTITIPEYSSIDDARASLLLNVIHAYHGPAVLQYDAWEQGFARAATSVVMRLPVIQQYLQQVGSFYAGDATANLKLSLLSYYDLLNQPALGNSTFFPQSQVALPLPQIGFGRMFLPRLGMCGAAWLKVYIENQNFFSQFNDAYYAQASSNSALAGNVPALRALAAAAAPNVEGQAFSDWFVQQYILDTSIVPGTKLYAVYLPGTTDSDGQLSNAIALDYYTTAASGDETPKNGTAHATFLDDQNIVNNIAVGSATISGGEGTLSTSEAPTTGDARRLAVQIAVGQSTAQVYAPNAYSGDFQGVLLGPGFSTGTVSVQQQVKYPSTTLRTANVSAARAGFGATLSSGSLELAANTITVTTSTGATTFHVNSGDGLYYAILRTGASGGSVVTKSFTFPQSNNPRIVSFPVTPVAAAPDAALGLSGGDFLLAYWDTSANSSTGGFLWFNPGQPSFPRLEPGRGYLLKIGPQASGVTSETVQIQGTTPPTDMDYAVAVPFGWSLIGSPFGTDIPLSQIRVQALDDLRLWDDATSANYIDGSVWDFVDSGETEYNEITSADSGAIQGSQWKGYWVHCSFLGGVTLLLPGPDAPAARAVRIGSSSGSTRAAALVPRVTPKPDWQVTLTAHQAPTTTRFVPTAVATLGMAKGVGSALYPQLDREAPPALSAGVQAQFVRPGWRGTGGRLVGDVRDSGAAGATTWTLNVTTPAAGPATLSWSGVGTLPRRTRLTLIDTVSGTRTPFQGHSSYTWTGEAGKTRAFQIVAAPQASTPLSLVNIQVTRTRAAGAAPAGMNLSYTVLGDPDATVQVTVSTVTGRVLRRLDDTASAATGETDATGKAISASTSGQQRSVFWDGRSAEGASLPGGPYMLTFTVRGTDGSIVRQVRPVMITR